MRMARERSTRRREGCRGPLLAEEAGIQDLSRRGDKGGTGSPLSPDGRKDECRPHPPVIPAKPSAPLIPQEAGIQGLSWKARKEWMPAYAGMSGKVVRASCNEQLDGDSRRLLMV